MVRTWNDKRSHVECDVLLNVWCHDTKTLVPLQTSPQLENIVLSPILIKISFWFYHIDEMHGPFQHLACVEFAVVPLSCLSRIIHREIIIWGKPSKDSNTENTSAKPTTIPTTPVINTHSFLVSINCHVRLWSLVWFSYHDSKVDSNRTKAL